MSATTTTPTTTTAEAPLAGSWRYLAGVGAIIGVLGLLAIAFPFVTGLGISTFLGVVLVVGAIAHLVHAVRASDWTGSAWQIVLAVLYGIAGVALLVNPLFGLATLTLVLAAFFVAEGVAEIVMAARLRSEGSWGWLFASGVLGVLVGGLIWFGWPSTAIWAVGVLFGVNLLSTGLSMVLLAMTGRTAAREAAAAPRTGARGA